MKQGLRANILANYLGQGWRGLIGLVFIPVYIAYLGIEAYGLIAIFGMLQAWLVLVDLGMKPALSREMARFTGGARDLQSIWDLLRTVEIIGVGIAVGIALMIWGASGWLASNWLKSETVPTDVAAGAFAVMGLVTALRLVEGIYFSSLAGLQHQVLQNILATVVATVRAVGAIAVLAFISPTIVAFFAWQGIVSVLTVAILIASLYGILPRAARLPRFCWSTLSETWRFSAGVLVITLFSLLLTQVDKILLTRLVSLEGFAHYALAGVMSGALYMLIAPINSVYYPRFIELAARGNETALRATYHQSAQIVTVLMGAAASVLVVFNAEVVHVWMGDAALAQEVAPILSVLALGTLANGLLMMPYAMQLAHGWISLEIKLDIVYVAVLVPVLCWAVPKYGPIAAAWVWLALNAGSLAIGVPLMHRRLLKAEMERWYWQDVALPLAGAFIAVLLCRALIPHDLSKAGELAAVIASASCALLAAALLAPVFRRQFGQQVAFMSGWIRSIAAGPP